ncbi:hypothetical protein D9757_006885 [Collybiopsis confluens]|uniref:Bromo domain-containing protein n=1 Tax=Collybiopsis confluens TaxID=2823264 RepID=A0A8H5MAC9_9AGAR|nr:hypothetical protein D9757_006885 [Collybiopsis confluens]
MNNLLKTLSSSKVKAIPDVDLKSLLNTVKDGRGRKDETALSNAFYESLEGVLVDLRTVTLDNHDAEPFLKPVSRAEVQDYYDVISMPMDFSQIAKKLKARHYKSKKEFKDDLDLIWSNCRLYNKPDHPFIAATARLKVKADKLLANVTDRKERIDPHLPSDLAPSATLKLNGINGRAHTRTPSLSRSSTMTSKSSLSSSLPKVFKIPRRSSVFEESPALVRTPEGMAKFRELDQSLQAGPSSAVDTRMREMVSELEDDYDSESANLGDKRKPGGIHPPLPTTSTPTDDDLTQLWWTTVQSDSLLPNGLPEIPIASSSSSPHPFFKLPIPDSIPGVTKKKKRRKKLPDSYRPEDKPKALLTMMNNNIRTIKRVRHTNARFAALGLSKDIGEGDGDNETTGPVFSAPASAGVGLAGGDAMDIEEVTDDRVDERPWKVPTRRGRRLSGIEIGNKNADDSSSFISIFRDPLDPFILIDLTDHHLFYAGTSKAALDVLSGVASGYLLNVGRTLKFLVDKFANAMSPEEILLHTLFESGISEIQDLERYVADDVERYGSRLADLEKKLVGAYREITSVDNVEDEGLFDEEEEEEASALALGEFADVLGVDYFGLRELGIADEFGMQSLTIPKRLLKGKKRRENLLPVAKPTEPPPPFPPPPPFIPLTAGQLPEQIGLLQKFYQDRLQSAAPPPPLPVLSIPSLAPPSLPGPILGNPYPIPSLPKPSIPPLAGPLITSSSATVPQPSSHSPTNHPPSSLSPSSQAALPAPLPLDTVIPDESPTAAQVKMGPLGQIVKTGASYPTAKKKTKAAAAAAAAAVTSTSSTSNNVNAIVTPTNVYPPSATPNPASAVDLNGGGGMMNGIHTPGSASGPGLMDVSAVPPPVGFVGGGNHAVGVVGSGVSPSPSPTKKKKGMTGVGGGNGGKKKAGQTTQAQNNQHGQQDPRPPPFPPVVAASA